MKKLITIIILSFSLMGCSGNESQTNETINEISDLNSEQNNENNKENNTNEVSESKEDLQNEIPSTLSLEEFNERYELDLEFSEPYINGKFQLKDGTIIYADWYFYLEGDTFYYASAKFIEGKLVHLQLDLKEDVAKEDVLKEFNLTEDVNYRVNENTNVAVIVIDERFDKSNISRLPNEWD